MKPIVILDNGHGEETAGKRSPVWGDGSQLFEWEFNRDIVRRIAAKLDDLAIGYEILTPETNDVSLAERCRRANEFTAITMKRRFWYPSMPTPEAVRVGRFTRRPEKESGCNRHGICRGSATGIRPGRLAYAFRLCRRRPG